MPIRLQTTTPAYSKQGSLFLGEDATGTWTGLDDDLSQYFSNATAGAGQMTMASTASDRLEWTNNQTTVIQCTCNNTDTGTFFSHDTAGNQTLFDISVAGTLRASVNGGVVGSLAIPGLSASNDDYVFAWASRPNPLTTGASDAVQSWLYIIDVTGTQVARTEFSHAVASASSATATWGTYTGTITSIHHLRSCQSFTEVAVDTGYSSPTGPTTACEVEEPPLPVTVASGWGDQDALYGPQAAWAAVHASHARRRTWTPLANTYFLTQPELRSTTGAGDQAYRLAPGSTLYRMLRSWGHEAPVPPGATHVWVRLHVQSWVTSGAAVPLGLRVYSCNRHPDFGGEELTVSIAEEIVTRDDTASGTGQWDVEVIIPIQVGADGWTYLFPAFAFDPNAASANDANARAQINAFHAVPCYRETAGGV